MPEKTPAWLVRDTKAVAQEGMAVQSRTNWRKVVITCDPITGNIVLEYGHPMGASVTTHITPTEFIKRSADFARLIGYHVTPQGERDADPE